jgi:hypothetical protein
MKVSIHIHGYCGNTRDNDLVKYLPFTNYVIQLNKLPDILSDSILFIFRSSLQAEMDVIISRKLYFLYVFCTCIHINTADNYIDRLFGCDLY